MLGSAIPKRWVVSLALVGLVSLFMASYTAVWSDSAVATTTSTVPGVPLTVVAVGGSGQATISWDAPAFVDGHQHITGYSVVGTPSTSTVTTDGSTLSAVISGLTNGTEYTFAVTATNSIGVSVSSTASNGVTPVHVPTGGLLTSLLAQGTLSLQTGKVITLSVVPIDDLGNEDLDMPNVSYVWSAGSCGSLTNAGTRTPTFTAGGSAGSCDITVHAIQGDSANIPDGGLTIAVSVTSPPPPPAATAVPSNPASVTVVTPSGLSASDIDVITPVLGGIASGAIGTGLLDALLSVPSGALDSNTVAAVQLAAILLEDVPAPPPTAATEGASSGTFTFGSSILEISWYAQDGTAFDSFSLNRPAEICVPFNSADIAGASGGPDGLGIWRYNGTDWVPLASSVNTFDGTVCANTSIFSVFALGLEVAPPVEDEAPAPVAGLPVTGDYTPGVGALILAMLAGIALIATGAFTARRARRVRTRS